MADTPASALDVLFRPRSLAVVGASGDANKIGGRPIAFLKRSGWDGALYPVNPNTAEVQGLAAYRSLSDIPGAIDQAIIAVPPGLALGAVREAAVRKVRVVQILSAGFAETGDEGAHLQRAILDVAHRAGMRVLGPNSLGVFSVAEKFFGTFATALDGAWPRSGDVGFATQSGAFGSYCYALAEARGMGFSHFAATGNEADIDVAECMAWLARDAATRVIVATFEGCRNGRRLIAALELARRMGKPVIVMKAGSSEAGVLAAATHTGSLAGEDAVYDGIFRQFGAHRAVSLDELVDCAYAASLAGLPASNRLGVITTSGGVGVLMADACAAHGVALPPLPSAAAAQVKAMLPHAGAANPLDTTAALINDLSLFVKCMAVMAGEADCDMVLGFLAHVGRNPKHYGEVRGPLFDLRDRFPDKIFALSLLCPPQARAELEAHGFLVFAEPTRAVAALGALARIRNAQTAAADPPPPAGEIDPPRGPLNEAQAKSLVAEAGIPSPPEKVARSADEAAAIAAGFGAPLAMKILSADITHKSDCGGVRLGVSVEDAARAWRDIIERVGAAMPLARIDGVLMTPMLSGGVETILGVTRDPVFGPVVMFGLGGVFVEVLRDVAFRAAPFGVATARAMIASTLADRFLAGVRGAAAADTEALAAALARLSAFAHANARWLQAIEINPYLLNERGGMALDAVVVPTETRTEEGVAC